MPVLDCGPSLRRVLAFSVVPPPSSPAGCVEFGLPTLLGGPLLARLRHFLKLIVCMPLPSFPVLALVSCPARAGFGHLFREGRTPWEGAVGSEKEGVAFLTPPFFEEARVLGWVVQWCTPGARCPGNGRFFKPIYFPGRPGCAESQLGALGKNLRCSQSSGSFTLVAFTTEPFCALLTHWFWCSPARKWSKQATPIVSSIPSTQTG